MSFRRYPKHKPSGVEWLGDVPEHWEVQRARWLFEIKKRIAGELGHDVLSITQRGVKVKDIGSNDGQISMDYSKYQLVEVGDFAMNHMDLLTGWVDLSPVPGVTSPDYRVFALRDPDNIHDRYLLYVLQMGYSRKIFYAYGQGSSQLGRWRLPSEQFNDLRFPLPPVSEQQVVVSFLDRETAKIDALVAEQQRLIELLNEKRQAVISHAVTKGLNPGAPMKDSGVEWLGQVPAHWDVAAVRRHLNRVEQGWSPDCLGRPAEAGEWGVLKAGCVNRGVYVQEENKALPVELEPAAEYEVHEGDVLVSRASGSPALVGSTAMVGKTRPQLMISDKIFRLRLGEGLRPDFFVAAFNSCGLRSQIERAISGADGLANNLPQAELRAFFLAVPPVVEQQEIVSHLTAHLQRLDALAQEGQRAIDLLQERRTALISAAVTGQIDVRPESMRTAA